MDPKMIIELVGYLGSALVVVSMLMSSVVKLRIINLVGCVIFSAYALIIKTYPTAAMNIILCGINIYQLYRLTKAADKSFSVVECATGDGFVDFMLTHYKNDIADCFPTINLSRDEVEKAYIVCNEGVPAGVMLANKAEDDVYEILLDYSTPTYRDLSVGTFLYEKLGAEGVKVLRYVQEPDKHEDYLKKMGFEMVGNYYEKKLG